MELLTLWVIAVILSFDSFAVSVSCGLIVRNVSFNRAFRSAFIFSIIQGLCFFTGSLLGQSVKQFISSYDHWVAFILLGVIGGKMIYESFKKKETETDYTQNNPLRLTSTFLMALATSIDAIIVGLGVSLISMSTSQLGLAIVIIAFVTGIAVMMGMLIGKTTSKHIGAKAELIGGITLVIIGVKVLTEHLTTVQLF